MIETQRMISEAIEITERAAGEGVTVRVLGGVAVAIHGHGGVPPSLVREYEDIDLVTTRRDAGRVIDVLSAAGYAPNERFNAMNGHRRLIAQSAERGVRVDVFVGEFSMCHAIPVADRLDLEARTVPLAELLTTKLQIVELNRKDAIDILALLAEHDVGDRDEEMVNAAWIADLFARDWGLWRTGTQTLANVERRVADSGLDERSQGLVTERVGELMRHIDETPKSMRWKTRSRVGDRVKWYDEPEEIAHGNAAGATP